MFKPNKFFAFLALMFITISATSCFDIYEEYHFNKDGSGDARFTVDVGQLMTMMESFASSMDSTGKGAGGIDEMFEKNDAVKKLNQVPGISKVLDRNDKGEGIVGFSYHFDNLEALNNAIIATDGEMDMAAAMGMGEQNSASESDLENFFTRKGNKWTRTFEIQVPENDEEDSEDAKMKDMAEMMFADHFYSIKYTFDQQVKKVKKNDNATIGSDGKTVLVKTPMQDLIKGDASFSSQIKVK